MPRAHSDPAIASIQAARTTNQFNSPRLVKREAGFPNPRRALIGSNQLWRVNDSPYCREYVQTVETAGKQTGLWSPSGPWSSLYLWLSGGYVVIICFL